MEGGASDPAASEAAEAALAAAGDPAADHVTATADATPSGGRDPAPPMHMRVGF